MLDPENKTTDKYAPFLFKNFESLKKTNTP